MNHLRPDYEEFEFVLRVICVVAAGAALSLLTPVNWRAHFARARRG